MGYLDHSVSQQQQQIQGPSVSSGEGKKKKKKSGVSANVHIGTKCEKLQCIQRVIRRVYEAAVPSWDLRLNTVLSLSSGAASFLLVALICIVSCETL